MTVTLLKPILQVRRNEVGPLETADVATLIRGKSAEEAEEILYQIVAEEIAAALRVPVTSVSRDKVLKDIGLDSLMAIELGMSFQARTGHDMPLNGLTDSTTVGEIVAKLYRRISKSDEPAEIAGHFDDLTVLAERHREQAAAGSQQEVRLKRTAK